MIWGDVLWHFACGDGFKMRASFYKLLLVFWRFISYFWCFGGFSYFWCFGDLFLNTAFQWFWSELLSIDSHLQLLSIVFLVLPSAVQPRESRIAALSQPNSQLNFNGKTRHNFKRKRSQSVEGSDVCQTGFLAFSQPRRPADWLLSNPQKNATRKTGKSKTRTIRYKTAGVVG